jgi:hypothetical protein
MKHKFQNPHLKALAKRLVELDNTQATMVRDACSNKKYRTIADRASDYGVVFSNEALTSLTDTANKESIRQGKPVGDYHGANIYHPKVLDAVFAKLAQCGV